MTDEECMAPARECPLTKKRAARAALQYLASSLVPACAPPPAGQSYTALAPSRSPERPCDTPTEASLWGGPAYLRRRPSNEREARPHH